MGLNSILLGSTLEMECAAEAKNSYCKYLTVCNAESKISPLYSSRMYSHSNTCLSISWNATFADSKVASACKYRLSVGRSTLALTWSNIFRAVFSCKSLCLLVSKLVFRLRLFTRCCRIGCMILYSMSRRNFAKDEYGASDLVIALVASFILQQSDWIKGSSLWPIEATKVSLSFSNPSQSVSMDVINVSTCLYTSCKLESRLQKSRTVPSNTGSAWSPLNNFSFRTANSVSTE
mmetsp:Transcript_33233/g.86113  ORF Transcript_33233/g.86113 Transcript_33233/m.86113 type:complete len:234 (-) Transcript_33233:69-770(-)